MWCVAPVLALIVGTPPTWTPPKPEFRLGYVEPPPKDWISDQGTRWRFTWLLHTNWFISGLGTPDNGPMIGTYFGDEDEDDYDFVDCPRACNPRWPGRHIVDVCGPDVPCCQTKELLPADCIRDVTTGLWRTMDGRDAEAAALCGDARWGEGGTHQDPDFAGCEAIADARSGELFLECVRQLGVADQRGFCGGDVDSVYAFGETGHCAAAPARDICAELNE